MSAEYELGILLGCLVAVMFICGVGFTAYLCDRRDAEKRERREADGRFPDEQ